MLKKYFKKTILEIFKFSKEVENFNEKAYYLLDMFIDSSTYPSEILAEILYKNMKRCTKKIYWNLNEQF